MLSTVSMVSGCAGRPLPAAIAAAGWSDVQTSDRDEIVALIGKWREDAASAQGSFRYRIAGTGGEEDRLITVTVHGEWRSVQLRGELRLWEDRRTGSPQHPVTIWARSPQSGESERDLVACVAERCTDVSAWYVLAALDHMTELPEEVGNLTPQEVYQAAALGPLDVSVLTAFLDMIDMPVSGTVASDGGVEHFTLEDRVYVVGHRAGATGEEICLGWFDRAVELTADNDRFVHFCQSPEAKVFSAVTNDELVSYAPLPVGGPHEPKVDADLYDMIDPLAREYIVTMGYVNPQWVRRHQRA